MQQKVEKALAKVRPSLQADGGDVELIEVSNEGVVKVRLTGACGGCPMASMTLQPTFIDLACVFFTSCF